MGTTKTTDRDFNVQVLNDAVDGVFASQNAFLGSILVSQGAVVVRDDMEGDGNWIGNEITVPYFGIIGEFEDNPEDTAAVPKVLKSTHEKGVVARSSLAFEVSRWARHSDVEDKYEVAARQIGQAALRRIDELAVTAANTTPLALDVFSQTNPQFLDWEAIVEGKAMWGDRQNDIVAMVVHSRIYAELRKLRDADGRLLIAGNMQSGEITRFDNIPLLVSDRVPLNNSGMSAVSASGTSPPTVTLSGTPLGPWKLRIKVATTGASDGTAAIQFSVDDGRMYSDPIAVPSGGGPLPLIDTAADSMVGRNGKTGLTATFQNGTYNANNVYTSTAVLKATTLILQRGAVAFWYNRRHAGLQTDKDILKDNDVAAMHLYHVAHRYRRRVGGELPGVVAIRTNLRGFTGTIV